MTVEEEVAALKTQVADLNIKVTGIETINKIFNDALITQTSAIQMLLDRLDRNERWWVDISAIVRHLLEHTSSSMKTIAEEPASAPKKDTQRGIEVG